MSAPDLGRHFPWTTTIGGAVLTLRLMRPEDREAFMRFAQSLPEADLMFLRTDITTPEGAGRFVYDLEQGRTVTILVEEAGQIVAYGALHYNQLRWTRHMGEIRLMTTPRLRGKGLGKLLAHELFTIARNLGLQKLMARMASSQMGARQVFQHLGFHPEALLHDFVIDPSGRTQDLVFVSHDVSGFNA